MKLPLDLAWSSWFAMGCVKTLVIAICGGAFIACVRERNLAARLWMGLALLLPLAFFSGLLPLSWKVLPPAAQMERAFLPLPLLPTTAPSEAIPVDEPLGDVSAVTSEAVPSPTETSAASTMKIPGFSPSQMLTGLWILGGLISLLPSFFAWCAARRLRGTRAPAPMFSQWQKVAGSTADFVPLRISPDISSPGVASALRPVVLLPESASDWPEERLRSVLRHELHHIEQRDLFCRWLGRAVRALLWFHPVAWWVQSRIVIAQERAADEAVVAAGVPAADYAGHLLETVSEARCFPGLAMARRSQIGGRIHLLLARREAPAGFRRFAERFMALVAAAATVVLAILGFAAPEVIRAAEAVSPAPPVAKQEKRPDIVDRRGEIIATSNPAKMPEALRERPPLRWYPDGEVVGHLSGWVQPGKNGELIPVEKSGLEASPLLQEGKELQSTIDLRAQRLVWNELVTGQRRGSIVVMDPRKGEVVAMASWPAINPNAYADGVTEEEMIAWRHDDREPLRNRALSLDEPGTFANVILALGAASYDLTGRKYSGHDGFFKSGKVIVRDQHPIHGETGLRTALMRSSNVYCAQLAMEMGHEKFSRIWSDFNLPLAEGSMWQAPAARWYPANASGEPNLIELTRASYGYAIWNSSLERAALLSTVASGSIRQPSFVVGEQVHEPVAVAERGVDQNELALIQQALNDSVNGPHDSSGSGSGSRARAKLPDLAVAGISGTSLLVEKGRYVSGSYVASFTAYAPAKAPRYVVAVRLESGEKEEQQFYGTTIAGPVAARVLKGLVELGE